MGPNAVPVKNNMEVPQKKIISIQYSNSSSGYINKRTESQILKTYLWTHVHSSTTTVAEI